MQQEIPRVIFLYKDALQEELFLREVVKLLERQNIIAAIEESPCHGLRECDLFISGCSVEHQKVYPVHERDRNHLFFLTVQLPVDISSLVTEVAAWWRADIATRPLWGCVLVGGMSRRMGHPKHLIQLEDGKTWLERIVVKLLDHVDNVVVSGEGTVPASLHHLKRVEDTAGARGPLAGVLSAMRQYPAHSWLVAACDMPLIESSAIHWLLAQRKEAYWGVVPKRTDGTMQPLLAYYDFRSRYLFEALFKKKNFRITEVGLAEKIVSPVIPQAQESSWYNCNTPEDVEAALGIKWQT